MLTSMATLDDATLVQMALAGHNEYFGELMRRHMNYVRVRVVSIVRNSPDVDDVVQEVFFKAWRALSTFRAEATMRTWLTRIATNEALMLCRRERRLLRLHETSVKVETMAWRGEPADKTVMRGEVVREVRGAIVKLPVKYRNVVVLSDLEELTAPVAAKRLKSSVPAVKTRLFRARLRLAKVLRASRAQAMLNAA